MRTQRPTQLIRSWTACAGRRGHRRTSNNVRDAQACMLGDRGRYEAVLLGSYAVKRIPDVRTKRPSASRPNPPTVSKSCHDAVAPGLQQAKEGVRERATGVTHPKLAGLTLQLRRGETRPACVQQRRARCVIANVRLRRRGQTERSLQHFRRLSGGTPLCR